MATTVGTNELGEAFAVGDRVFSHYTMQEGVVGEPNAGLDGWFYLTYPSGERHLLDASRICSLAHARRMGWLS